MEYYQLIVEKHWKRIYKTAETIARNYGKLHLVDDMFSDVIVNNAETIYKSFDAKRGDDIEQFMLTRFRYYFRKWLSNYCKHGSDDVSLQDIDPKSVATTLEESSALDAADEVKGLIGVIADKVDRRLVILKASYGYTFEELSKLLETPESTIRVRYNELLKQLKWYADQRRKRGLL